MEKSKTLVLCENILKAAKSKNVFLDEQSIQKYLKTRAKKNAKPYKLPISLTLSFAKNKAGKMDYYTIGEKCNKTIVYFHGGAFINRPLLFHFTYLKKLQTKTQTKIYVPIYPLAPLNTYIETYQALDNMYEEIINANSNSKIIFMGDSAGGTLCFSYFNHIKKKYANLPVQLIAFSPCVDTTLSNPEIEEYNKHDIMLHSYGCRIAIKKWLNNADEKDEETNPIFSKIKDLPNSIIFVGTNEIMYPDIIKFEKKAKKENMDLIVEYQKDFGHCYPLFPAPESNEALKKIIEIIKKL